jgi:dTMP kinase
MFLVLEGGDGSGKSTQLARLADFFRKTGKKPVALHFPRLDAAPYGEMIAAYLRGEFGGLERVHPRLAALLYALDRREAAAELRQAIQAGGTVLADRYLFSNLAYQGARTADPAEREKTLAWIEKLEYGQHGIPRPDLTLYLDAPLSFSLDRLSGGRAGPDREYLRGAADIHEADRDFQARVREEYLKLAKKRPGEIGVVDCRDGDGMAGQAAIHSRVVDALRRYGLA